MRHSCTFSRPRLNSDVFLVSCSHCQYLQRITVPTNGLKDTNMKLLTRSRTPAKQPHPATPAQSAKQLQGISKIALQHAKSFCRLCLVLLSYWPELASSLSYLLLAWNTAVQFLLCVSSQGCGSEVDRRARGVQCSVGRLVRCKTAG